jgi:hypothetical protein
MTHVKSNSFPYPKASIALLALAGLLATTRTGFPEAPSFVAASPLLAPVEVTDGDEQTPTPGEADNDARDRQVTAITPEEEATDRAATPSDLPWLGLATEEASEVLTSQLGLPPGVGLVVTFVASNSPAQKAGLCRNDVLVEFDQQSLVHPAQLRKLVRVHKEGDQVKLTYYRGGKKESISAILGKLRRSFGMLDEGGGWQRNLRELETELKQLPIKEAIREQMRAVRDSLGTIRIDQKKVQADVKRSMEDARKALQEAMRGMSNVDLGPARKALERLAQSGVSVDQDATVTVRSTGKSNKSIVKSDESGTVVLIANPALRLTAHDKDGHLVFDGEIQTSEQQAKVPRELWERVQPLVEKLNSSGAEETETKEAQ